ncbi:MAG: hypothetical protein JNJ45_05565 [Chthonomonas sp.]|nr:hypothetical protein [Chthonomonas sp.]
MIIKLFDQHAEFIEELSISEEQAPAELAHDGRTYVHGGASSYTEKVAAE